MFFTQRKQSTFAERVRLCFVPHESNDFIPKAAQHKMLFGYSFALLALKVVSLLLLIFLPAANLYSSAITRTNILSLTNAARANTGLTALTLNDQLNQAAQAKAQDMLTGQYFAHTSPSGVTPWSWIHGSGYVYQLAGENLAVHYAQSEDVQSAWMASPTHRANILNERFQDVGIGIVSGVFEGFDTMFVVQMFGQPKEVPITVPVVDGGADVAGDAVPAVVPAQDTQIAKEASAPEVAGETDTLEETLPITNVVITPTKQADIYSVHVATENVERVNVEHNGEVVVLESTGNGEFEGEIRSVSAAQGDGLVVASLITGDGTHITKPVAVLASSEETADFYAFAPRSYIKLFNLVKVNIIQDSIALVYAAAVVFICALLLLTVLIRFEHQRHSVTAHLLVVLTLASILLVL